MDARHKLPLHESPAVAAPPRDVGPRRERPADDEGAEAREDVELEVYDPCRGGLSAEALAALGERLYEVWPRFHGCFTTRTRATRAHAYAYLRGQLTRDTERNVAHRARTISGGDGQALQHFLSNSPWSGPTVFEPMQAEIKATPALAQGGTLIRDESAEEKAGTHNVGASRPYNGRRGKVDICRVATGLIDAHGGVWTLVDGELFWPEAWFGADWAERRRVLGLPPERACETKLARGWKMVTRGKGHGLPFDLVACDAFSGRDRQFRTALEAEGVWYAAQVPADTLVDLREPQVGVPTNRSTKGRPRTRRQVLSPHRPHEVRTRGRSPQTAWPPVQGRHTARGWWAADVAVRRVWTVTEGKQPRAEGVVMRRDAEGDGASPLLKAPEDAPPERLIPWSCRRYFTERPVEEAKTESGGDEFQAQKYRAWEPHVALTAVAWWFVAQTKLEWAPTSPRDPELAHQLGVAVVPALSTAHVREWLKAVLPLRQLTLEQATELVITHLIHRARSISSRLQAQMNQHDSS
jgi:SRSO17 transposase